MTVNRDSLIVNQIWVQGHILFMVQGSGFMVKLIIWHTRRNIAK